jgi:hypothetical protein
MEAPPAKWAQSERPIGEFASHEMDGGRSSGNRIQSQEKETS